MQISDEEWGQKATPAVLDEKTPVDNWFLDEDRP
jgi:hypothetical protein